MSDVTLPDELIRFGQELTVREGRAFYYQDDPCARAFFLVSGTVRPVKFATDGKPFDLAPVRAGLWFGLAELLSGTNYLFDTVAASECRAIAFTRINLDRAFANPVAMRAALEGLASEVVLLHRFLADEDAQGKILTFLLSRRRAAGTPGSVAILGTVQTPGSVGTPGTASYQMERTCVRLTQNDLADSVGLSRETVNRQLKQLERMGLVIVGRGEVAIPDWEKLESFASNRSR